ncbi:Protein of unknown function [Pyronema omphalodes CBS 100304]|uniref:Uncharacterized protein n=1 Tax=Pyronema omphalodes (strain CBS 100304) TaxID=1076935 RepID=U4LDH5_PYROM|nr:Protein of unknown function [Pyronema omphalodes CBS 100304]
MPNNKYTRARAPTFKSETADAVTEYGKITHHLIDMLLHSEIRDDVLDPKHPAYRYISHPLELQARLQCAVICGDLLDRLCKLRPVIRADLCLATGNQNKVREAYEELVSATEIYATVIQQCSATARVEILEEIILPRRKRAIEVIGEIRNVYKSSLYNAIRRLEHEEDGLDKLRNDIKRQTLRANSWSFTLETPIQDRPWSVLKNVCKKRMFVAGRQDCICPNLRKVDLEGADGSHDEVLRRLYSSVALLITDW